MSLLPLARVGASAVASTSRAFATSAVVGKAKVASKTVKKQRQGFKKGEGGKQGGGGTIKAGGLALKTALAHEPADLTDLVQLYPESVIPLNVGKASTFPRNTYDQLKTFGLPARVSGELGAAGTPASVIRQQTLDLVQALDGAKSGSSKDARLMLSGPKGAGKSMLLLQAVSYAVESGWIVLYEPRAGDWVNASSQHSYDSASATFHQPELASKLLQKLLAVNRDRLAGISLSAPVKLGETEVSTLDALVSLGAKDARLAVPALEATLTALSEQKEFPVLLAIDEAHALFGRSDYKTPDYRALEAYHLSTPRSVLDFMSGRRSFAKGAVVGAVSWRSPEKLPSEELLHGIGEQTRAPVHAYSKHDEHYLAYAKGIKRVEVPLGMSGKEAGAMFELWTRKGWASNASDDVFLSGFNAGAGNPLELSRSWLTSHYSYMV